MREAHPVAQLRRPHGEDVAQDIDLELVEVAVDAGAYQCLQLVRAALYLVLGPLFGRKLRRGIVLLLLRFGRFEPER